MYVEKKMFDIVRVAEVVVVTPLADLSELEFRQIEEEFHILADDPTIRLVVVDFGRTNYMGSTAIGMLVYLWKKLKQRGGELALCNVSPHEREIIKVVGLTELLKVYSSRLDALQALAA
jgi:stage II sporulation protein AA (anti-sigma F factor antagonist)